MKTPLTEGDIRKLKVGDVVYLSGVIVTARDAAHKRITKFLREGRDLPINVNGQVIYHCGPIMRKIKDGWMAIAAGPTTSIRMEKYAHTIIEKFKVRLIIGKGGMGQKTERMMKKVGCVYGTFTGGAAVLAAQSIRKVKGVEWLDLGMPEALWILEVEDFGPLIISIDTHGNNLFRRVHEKAKTEFNVG